jgi:AraC-like DNA-binding protein/mannose-6-phosphate isomerase-like protein (cupin superfamily)
LDALSTVLHDMRLEGAGYRSMELGGAWRVGFRQQGLRGIHIVLDGHCEIALDDGLTETLGPGDLVLTPRADPHELRSVGGSDAPLIQASDLADHADGMQIRYGGTSDRVRVLCGAFVFHESDRGVLAALPHLIRVPSNQGGASSWLAPYIEALTNEASSSDSCGDLIMARLSEALVARALRHHAESMQSSGWLRGLADVHLAKALAAIHGNVGKQWTLGELARVSGLSRASFAARFTATIGEPAMQYLTGVRMRHAVRMLTRDRAPLAFVADAVGYGSEAAFSNAFKRQTGHAPGAYRRDSGRAAAHQRHRQALS